MGSQQQSFPLGELPGVGDGGSPAYSPPIIITQQGSPLPTVVYYCLFFTPAYCLSSKDRNATPVTFCGNGYDFLQRAIKTDRDGSNVGGPLLLENSICSFSLCFSETPVVIAI